MNRWGKFRVGGTRGSVADGAAYFVQCCKVGIDICWMYFLILWKISEAALCMNILYFGNELEKCLVANDFG